jgi:hypothetical protein
MTLGPTPLLLACKTSAIISNHKPQAILVRLAVSYLATVMFPEPSNNGYPDFDGLRSPALRPLEQRSCANYGHFNRICYVIGV